MHTVCGGLAKIMRGAMLYDPSRIGNATEALFEPEYWRARGVVSRPPAGRGAALFIEHEGHPWVLRHYRRGGLMARVSRDRYLWTGAARTRPFREYRLLEQLHREGLPVPAPVAARYRRRGLLYTGDLIVERIAHAQPLSVLLLGETLPPEQWLAVGRCVRRFHDAGVFHADLNAHNILIDAAGGVFLIDFDRGRRRAPGPWMQDNLKRLQRSLNKISQGMLTQEASSDEWRHFLHGYAQSGGAIAPPGSAAARSRLSV